MNQPISNQNIADPNWFTVAPGVWGMKDIFVNIYMVHNPSTNQWVLIDAGLKTSAPKIRKMAANIFSSQIIPSAIILTHGHFDHVGSLIELVNEWQVSVYAHPLESPYLTGKSAYPPPDPFVGGGIMPLLSYLFPRSPVDAGKWLREIPRDGSVPGLTEWSWLHTPGHAPGHISLYRKRDGVLLSGDAIITTNQQSAFAIMNQTKILSGPPKYFTTDWSAARSSASKLVALEPEVIAAGHGKPMRGIQLRQSMLNLLNNFQRDAVPRGGRYVEEAAEMDEHGVQYVPPFMIPDRTALTLIGLAVGITLSVLLIQRKRNRTSSKI
ncbi:MAG: MBL fold metallo-hydrolase [Chitinophagales bacterium]|nr:MBL fold metallo-hydrolase [Chitinophagales bacterium]